jgi:mRNA interferase MazF
VDFPYTGGGSKIRPALVVQSDHYNALLAKTIVAMITGNLKRAGEPAHLLVDPSTPEGATSGLTGPSLVSCNNLYTIDQTAILQTLGQLSPALMLKVNDCLRAALGLT